MSETSQFFDGYAKDFDAIYGNRSTPVNAVVNRVLRRSMRLRYERTIAGCEPIAERTVLDVGCGPGHYSVELAKRGARSVLGLDFAEGMLAIAGSHAERERVGERCRFLLGDFATHPFDGPFDYTILMGFMDYVKEPRAVIERAVSLTRRRAFFSFPKDGGLLALQRKIRYRSRCPLYMYELPTLERLFSGLKVDRVEFDLLARDYFVTVHV